MTTQATSINRETVDEEFVFPAQNILNLVIPTKRVLIRNLLPYDPSEKSGKRINEYAFVLHAVLLAIKSLKNNEFYQFDPLVGDNACQIRASCMALAFLECKKNIGPLEDKVTVILDKLEYLSFEGTQQSLNDVLVENDFDIELTNEEMFFALSFILSNSKVTLKPTITKNQKTVYKLLTKLDPTKSITNNFFNCLTTHANILLAEASVIFVRNVAELHGDEKIIEMVSENYTISHRHKSCISIFWCALALYHHAVVNKIPVVLWAEHIDKDMEKQGEFFALFQSNGRRYVEVSPDTLSNAPAIIIRASCHREIINKEEWRHELVQYDPYELFLSYAALHRQFPLEEKDHIVLEKNDEIFNHYKKIGNDLGCGLENPKFLFVTHIFLDAFENVSLKSNSC